MKQIFATIAFLSGMTCSLAGQDAPGTLPANRTDSVTVASYTTHEARRMDSIVQAKVNKQVSKEMKKWEQRHGKGEEDFLFDISPATQVTGIIGIIAVFTFPLILIGMICYYRHENKKERYEVIKQALAQGKEWPREFLGDRVYGNDDYLWRKGVKTLFLGLGLTFLLGSLDDDLASIGILILCIGGGEIVLGWFPSVSQVKSLCRKQGKEEKPGNGQPDSPYRNAAPQPETRQTAQDRPSDKTSPQEAKAMEGADGNDPTEAGLPEAQGHPGTGENEPSRTDTEESEG